MGRSPTGAVDQSQIRQPPSRRVANVDREHRERLVLQRRSQHQQARHLLQAGRTPGAEEVDQYDSPSIIPQRVAFACQIEQHQRWRCAMGGARLQRRIGTRDPGSHSGQQQAKGGDGGAKRMHAGFPSGSIGADRHCELQSLVRGLPS